MAYWPPKIWMAPTPGVRLSGSRRVVTMKSARSKSLVVGSVEIRPTIMRKVELDLATCTPSFCTASGSSLSACCSLFCTCTWAMSGSVPASNVRVMVTLPVEELSDFM